MEVAGSEERPERRGVT